MGSTNHKEILHTSLQFHCRDVYKILLWLAKYVHHWISNSMEILLVAQVPGRLFALLACQPGINTACWHKSAGFVDNRYNTDQ